MRMLLLILSMTFSFACHASHNLITVSSLSGLANNAHILAVGALFIALLYAGAIGISLLLEKYISLSRTAGMLLSGIILGPTGFNIARFFNGFYQVVGEMGPMQALAEHGYKMGPMQALAEHGFQHTYHVGQFDFLFQFFTGVCSLFAVSWLMWLAGYETDLKKVKSVGFIAVSAGILGALVPFIMCAGIIPLFGLSTTGACAIGLMFAATSISIPVALLVSLGKMDTRPARTTLAAAVVDDIVAVIMVSVFFSMVMGEGVASSGIVYTMLTMIFGLIGMIACGFYVFPQLYALARSFHAEAPFYLGILTMFLFYATAELAIGLAGITGAYFAGFFHARNSDARLEHAVAPFVTQLLLPLFLVGVGLQLDARLLSAGQWIVVATLTVLAIFSKLIACSGVIALENYRSESHDQWSWSETLIFGFSMVARGEVGLVIALLVKSAGLIDEQWYAAAVVALIITTVLTPLLVSAVFSLEEKGFSKGKHAQTPLQ